MSEVIDLVSDEEEEAAQVPVPAAAAAGIPDEHHATLDFVEVVISGSPKAKPRPEFMSWMRGGRMFRRVVNRANAAEAEFRNAFIHNFMTECEMTTPPNFPIFRNIEAVEVEIEFHRKLPLTCFVAGTRDHGLCFPNIEGTVVHDSKVPDADNLGKFVMDALNGVLCRDDRQLVKLVLVKLCHTSPPYNGKTVIKFRTPGASFVF